MTPSGCRAWLPLQGCERSVITYSSLISACEKAGDWKLALDFFEECTKDNCRPNVITFNSLISACSQGASQPPQPQCLLCCRSLTPHNKDPGVYTKDACRPTLLPAVLTRATTVPLGHLSSINQQCEVPLICDHVQAGSGRRQET